MLGQHQPTIEHLNGGRKYFGINEHMFIFESRKIMAFIIVDKVLDDDEERLKKTPP